MLLCLREMELDHSDKVPEQAKGKVVGEEWGKEKVRGWDREEIVYVQVVGKRLHIRRESHALKLSVLTVVQQC